MNKWKKKAALKKLNNTIDAYWQPGIYNRKYTDRSSVYHSLIHEPDNAELKEILEQMGKFSQADMYNCGACGYSSCKQMALAIYNGKNKPQNCHYYVLDKTNENHFDQIQRAVKEITKDSILILEGTKGNVNSLNEITSMILQLQLKR